MAQQGEDIKFTLRGNNEINLDDLDFKVSVYKSCQCNSENVVTILKEKMTQITDDEGNGTNTFVGKIPYDQTKEMKEGYYDMELLTISGEGDAQERSIYTKKNVFMLDCSYSKNL